MNKREKFLLYLTVLTQTLPPADARLVLAYARKLPARRIPADVFTAALALQAYFTGAASAPDWLFSRVPSL